MASDQAPSLAEDQIAQGNHSQPFLEIAALRQPIRSELDPLFARAFASVNLPPIAPEAARWRIAYAVADEVLLEQVTPCAGAGTLWRIATELGMSDALSYFIYLGAECEELPENATTDRAWFDARIRETALDLVARAPEGREAPPPPS